MQAANQNPEQIARDQIDKHLVEAGWQVQTMKGLDWSAGQGIAVREYQTDTGPADYVLFVDRRAVAVIEAKPKEWGHKITTVEEQSSDYAAAKLKWVNNKQPLPFVYESTGVITPEGRWRKFTDDELTSRDKTSLDVFWLKDKSLTDLDNLPEPDELAEEIIENLDAGLASFRQVLAGLGKVVGDAT